MSMNSQEFSENRFEKFFQKWRQKFANAKPRIWRGVRQAFIWGVPIFLVFEILAVGLAINKLAGYGVPGDVARQHFYLTRYTLNLFLDTPNIDEFERVTNSPYIGFEHACDFFIADSLLGWRNHPKISCSFLYPAGGAPYTTDLIWTAFDVDGFAVTEKGGPRYIRDKPENVFRIIMLGGSTMVGYGASPLESIAGHAQRELYRLRPVADGYDRIEVINAGVAGFDSAQEYLYLLSELIYYKPDIVVFYDGWNESINRHGHFSDALFAYMRKAKKFKPVPFSSIQMKWHRDYSTQIEKGFRPWGAAVMLKSAISRSLRNSWSHTGINYWFWKYEAGKKWKSFWKSIFSLFKDIEKRPPHAVAIRKDFDPRTLRVFEENLRHSISLLTRKGIKGAFLLQPIIGVDGKTYSHHERLWADSEIGQAKIIRRRRFYQLARPLFDSLAKEFADEKAVCFSDISGAVKDREERLYVDEGHFNSKGYRIIAQSIIGQLAKCGFLELPETAFKS